MESKSIVVVGSCMIDFVSYAPRLPLEGETIHGTKFVTNFGGKGANQCVAAAKLGGETTLVARVGDDLWADKYIQNLKEQKVETKHVKKTPNSSSGIAQITVADSGHNQIVIVAGANNYLSVEDVESAKKNISEAAVVVLQLETSVEVAIRTMELSKGISILNGAPALSVYDSKLLTLPTIFCVNESEASEFTGLPINSPMEAEINARELIAKGCNSVLITLGDQGVVYLNKNNQKCTYVTCPSVQCIDSTGAGDSFIGSLAFLLATNPKLSMKTILESSCIIASDSVTRPGTQISFPRKEILSKCPL